MNRIISWVLIFFLGQTLNATELWSVDELKSKIDYSPHQMVLLDVRSPEEFASGKIKNSINIPHEELLSDLDLVSKYRGEKLVVYCQSGRRADLVINKLEDHGFTGIVDIKGDILAWSKANYPLEIEEGR